MRKRILLLLLICFISPAAHAAQKKSNAPEIILAVDASEAPRKIFHVHLSIPVTPGPLTLYYPQWIPGEHGPTGPLIEMAGLKLNVGQKSIEWQRDLVDMYTFRCVIPAGARTLDVSFDFLSTTFVEGFSAGASATSQLTVISWNQMLLYPQGWTAQEIKFKASLKLPDDWKFGTALPVTRSSGDNVQFNSVSLETLVDSPVICGAHYRVIDLTDGNSVHHELDIAGDTEASIQMSEKQMDAYRRLVKEANELFGAHHYREYHFLYTLSDFVTSFGLEHHESSDNRVGERTLLDKDVWRSNADLLSHEMVHSWNGKYRRPADLTTPDFQQPMKTDLLWVYEGLTQYLGIVLAARSGLWTTEDFMEHLAWLGAYLNFRTGRSWRPLVDTAVEAQLLYGARREWSDWRRAVDFYDEMALIWLEADVLIRQKTNGQKTLGDFCKRFHGAPSTGPAVKTYTFEDVVVDLNAICPYDWAGFFKKRIYQVAPRAPLAGIEAGGWRLVYSEQQNEILKSGETADKFLDFRFSLGMRIKDDGSVQDVLPGSPAADAGIAPGMKLIAVNGRRWNDKLLHEQVFATKKTPNLEMILENADFIKTFKVKYNGGERYPHLERDQSKPDVVGQIIQPVAK